MIRSFLKSSIFSRKLQTRSFALGMYCYQCEQTRGGKYCTVPKGVCGKTPEVSALQELILEVGKKTASYSYFCKALGITDTTADRWILDAYFSTLTNVNFDPKRFEMYLKDGEKALKHAKELYFNACAKEKMVPQAVINGDWDYKPHIETLMNEGRMYGIDKLVGDWDTICIKELANYGIKGGTAYLHHALHLGYEDFKLYETMDRMLHRLRSNNLKLEDALKLALEVGEWNYYVMELLDKANTGTYGKPEFTMMRVTPVKGKCIVVSGHDLRDLDLVLQQTVGKDINVYTHGEMLPCNAYPGLKKYKHLIGNYGGPWQRQREDFQNFPGSILMTTNCLVSPRDTYANRLFTRAVVGWPGVQHIDGDDMTPLIEAAQKEKGFEEDSPMKQIPIGFARDTVLGLAPVIIDAVKSGAIKHFFLIGGCDGYELERTYYTDFAKLVPKDCVILTCACGKFRFNMIDLGYIEFKGQKIPRILDCGQCNDAYSAIQIAKALSEAFNMPINDLPLSFVMSWFEQKAVAILLTLLHLGIKNMLLGPRLPAFIPPNVMKILSTNYGIRKITTPEADLKFCLSEKPE